MRGNLGRSVFRVAVMLAVPALLTGWTVTAVLAQASPSPSAAASPAASPGASPGASPAANPGAATGAGDANKGQQTFGTAGCTACHGSNLEGGIGPKLNPIEHLGNTPDPLSPAYLTHVITNGLSGVGGFSTAMPPKGGNSSLSDSDIQDLAAYIIQANKVPPGKQPLGPVELARSDVFWITVAIFAMVLITFLLARYNMRWIDRRAAARRDRRRSD